MLLRSCALSLSLAAALPLIAHAAAPDVNVLRSALERPIIGAGVTMSEVQEFTESRVPVMSEVSSAEEWTETADRLRESTLRDVVFRGEAAQWRKLPTVVEWGETISGGPGYRIRKLKYEAVPGLWIPALLYEPTQLDGKVPVVMNVNGHDGTGKAAEYKQLRCINQAKRGMLALNVEWLGMGQLRSDDFVHYRMNQLDLCGTSGLAPFYLSMKRGLDVLLEHEHADPNRVAVAGLSGGGWQTIFISSLDPRVTLADPVAGYSSFRTRARYLSDLGDSEQTPSDLATIVDYTHLTAMRAPRPTLLTFNDQDRCCFRAGHALPPLLEAVRPIYRLYGELDNLVAHVNHIPGGHNFEQDNREALYRMFDAHFFPDRTVASEEIPSADELKSADELNVDLPDENAGFNTLAKRLAEHLPRESDAAPAKRRTQLAELLHTHDSQISEPSAPEETDVETITVRYRTLRVDDTWTVPVVELTPPSDGTASGTVSMVLSEAGRGAAAETVRNELAAGNHVYVVDLFYFGECKIAQRDFLFALLVAAVGERPLGIQVDQLHTAADHVRSEHPQAELKLITTGSRVSLIGLLAAALRPELFDKRSAQDAFTSLHEVLTRNLAANDAPELFCFGLLEHFDVPELTRLADQADRQ